MQLFGVGRRLAVAVALVALLIGAGAPSYALSQSIDVRVEHGWARPAIAQGNGAAYLTLTNLGDKTVTLVGASSSVANFTEVHETYLIDPDHEHEGDVHDHGHEHEHHHAHEHHHDHGDSHLGHGSAAMLGMRKIEALSIAPGQEVHFQPGGLHVMLIDLVDGLAWGEQFDLTLHFEGGHTLTVTIDVGNEPSR